MRDDVYVGMLVSRDELKHYGKGHDDNPPGRGSGRYPYGSGKRPKQRDVSSPSTTKDGIVNVIKYKIPSKARHFIQDAMYVGDKATSYYLLATSALGIPFNPTYNIPLTGYYGWNAIRDIASLIKNGQIQKRKNGEIEDKRTGFKLKDKPYTAEEDCKNTNPLYHTDSPKRSHNCMLCTAAYDMRRRGYDVTAKPSYKGFNWSDYKRWYPKAKCWTVSKDNIIDELISQGNGARGNLMVDWNIPIFSQLYSYGHSVVYEVENNKLIIRDAQTGKTYHNPKKFLRFIKDDVDYIRLDNRRFDPKGIKECCE